MRTTVTIEDVVYEQVRRIAFESRRTLSDVINELLSEGLDQVTRDREPRRLGQLRGTITIADDFDDTPDEILDSLNAPI